MSISARLRRMVVAMLVLLLAAGTCAPMVAAQDVVIDNEAAARAEPDRLVDAAEQLMARGLLDEAALLLDKAESFGAQLQSVRFARAYLAQLRGDLDRAAKLYRDILVDEPEALRVRLELGRVYYLLGDDTKAVLQFRYALAGDLPETVEANVLRFLDQIRARRRWSLGVDFALAPDTNINAAPNTRSVDILGLPFLLDEDAREESGIGAELRFNGRFDVPLDDHLLLRQSAHLRKLEYEGSRFDDTSLFLRMGPLWRRGGTELQGSLLLGRRWYESRDYSRSIGARFDANTRLSPRLEAGIGLQYLHMDHDEADYLDGPRLQVSQQAIWALTPQSYLRGVAAIDRETAESATESNWGLFLALGWFVELPHGFSLYAEPGVQLRRFDKKAPAFDERREEITPRLALNLRNRKLDVFGFTPVFGVEFDRRMSSIDLYDYERARMVLGITREF
ncbi:MAG: surface lipoprotein assembly modifier [Geminicoccaceae bacterium]